VYAKVLWGKLHAYLLANRRFTQIAGLQEVTVWLCSRIGTPIDQPQVVSVQTYLQPGVSLADVTTPFARRAGGSGPYAGCIAPHDSVS
jgi:S-adenosylmethionine synthetase